jgi:ABC-type nitrate/sulfonate/bicarbonate transport system permease component
MAVDGPQHAADPARPDRARLWQFASATGVLPKSLMPSLFEVGRALAGLIASGEIVPHTLASLGRAGAGFFVAVVFGIAIGVLMARVHSVQLALEPILGLIYPVPKPALIPLFMVWLGIGNFSKIAVIALACLGADRHRNVQRCA